MVDLFGRRWTRNALLEHVGDISQVGGVRLVTFAEGPERDVLAGEVRTGSGSSQAAASLGAQTGTRSAT